MEPIKNTLLNAFPKALETDIKVVIDLIPLNPNYSKDHTVRCNDDALRIPYRIYFDDSYSFIFSKLTDTQKIILHCLYLRHHDGYVRQRHLEALAGVNEAWVVPYTLQLLGEYVLEILRVLNNIITNENIHHYKQFIEDNPIYWQQTISRMINYWHCYYKAGVPEYKPDAFPILNDYPGKQIVNRLI